MSTFSPSPSPSPSASSWSPYRFASLARQSLARSRDQQYGNGLGIRNPANVILKRNDEEEAEGVKKEEPRLDMMDATAELDEMEQHTLEENGSDHDDQLHAEEQAEEEEEGGEEEEEEEQEEELEESDCGHYDDLADEEMDSNDGDVDADAAPAEELEHERFDVSDVDQQDSPPRVLTRRTPQSTMPIAVEERVMLDRAIMLDRAMSEMAVSISHALPNSRVRSHSQPRFWLDPSSDSEREEADSVAIGDEKDEEEQHGDQEWPEAESSSEWSDDSHSWSHVSDGYAQTAFWHGGDTVHASGAAHTAAVYALRDSVYGLSQQLSFVTPLLSHISSSLEQISSTQSQQQQQQLQRAASSTTRCSELGWPAATVSLLAVLATLMAPLWLPWAAWQEIDE